MMRLNWWLAACTVAFGLTACASPKVILAPLEGQDPDGKTKYQLAESVILFQYGKSEKGQKNPGELTIQSVPTPAADIFSIDGTDWHENWGVETKINVTYRPNTRLIKEVGIEVSDRRPEIIAAVAKVATAAIGIAPFAQDSQTVRIRPPSGIATGAILRGQDENCELKNADVVIKCANYPLGGSPNHTADIVISAVPKDAVPKKDYLDSGSRGPVFYYSACRTMTITLSQNGDALDAASVTIADPRWLQTVRFPDKGKISMHSSCGVDVTAADSKSKTGFELAENLLTAAKSVKDAADKKFADNQN